MSINRTNTYSLDAHVAEIYDGVETQTDDVKLIRRLIAGRGRLRILEPFCGTGRILIPLASDGHEIVGFDQSAPMLDRARMKIARLAREVQQRITLFEADVTETDWPLGFDLVLLGGNCFYELASPGEQEHCIAQSGASLRPGGYVYVDNNHMEGELDADWRTPGVRKNRFPSGTCEDGARVEATTETVWFDAAKRLSRCRRAFTVTHPDGRTETAEWIQQKHPPSTAEVRTWLEGHGFVIEALYGDRAGNPYTDSSSRALFFARKPQQASHCQISSK